MIIKLHNKDAARFINGLDDTPDKIDAAIAIRRITRRALNRKERYGVLDSDLKLRDELENDVVALQEYIDHAENVFEC